MEQQTERRRSPSGTHMRAVRELTMVEALVRSKLLARDAKTESVIGKVVMLTAKLSQPGTGHSLGNPITHARILSHELEQLDDGAYVLRIGLDTRQIGRHSILRIERRLDSRKLEWTMIFENGRFDVPECEGTCTLKMC